VSAQPQSESEESPEREQQETGSARQPQAPGVWLPFLLFVAGFVILVAESKYTLPAAADYALKGLGGGLCLVTVVWIRRQARKSGGLRRGRLK
jgi:hypothetical protein